MEEVYEVKTADPTGTYHGCRKETRYGSRHKAIQITAAVNKENALRRYAAQLRGAEPALVELSVRVAPVGEFADVTAEFTLQGVR